VRRHLVVGYWSLLFFATSGLVLETLHGFKVPAYLDASNETRRLMWTLAHAHGTLLSVLNVVYALTLRLIPEFGARDRRLISSALIGATFLLPGGFLLGGLDIYGGDPGLGVLVVPFGAVLLLVAVLLLARAAGALAKAPGRETSGRTAATESGRKPHNRS
jgi:hypothetical protein